MNLSSSPERRRLLIIEDDEIVANVYRSRFEREGYEVEICNDGQSGFYRLHESPFSALLLDLLLPQMNGAEILGKIRAQKRFKALPVVVLTNAYLSQLADQARRAGAHYVLPKAGTSPAQVVAAVNAAISGPGFGAAPVPALPAPAAGPAVAALPAGAPAVPALPAPSGPMPPPGATISGMAALAAAQAEEMAALPAPANQPAKARQLADEAGTDPVWVLDDLMSNGTRAPALAPRPMAALPAPASPANPALVPRSFRPRPAAATPEAPAPMTARAIPEAAPSEPPAAPAGAAAPVRDQAALINSMRATLKGLNTADNPPQKLQHVRDMIKLVHPLIGEPVEGGTRQALPQLSEALEALLWELNNNPAVISQSTLMTLAKTTDHLMQLIAQPDSVQAITNPAVLVVDDDLFSRRAVLKALEKIKIKGTGEETPTRALELMAKQTFDLIITDVNMPDMNGFEMCKKLRALPTNKTTPVIFVTIKDDFERRIQSALSGGNELIAKPFLLMELAVKALVHLRKKAGSAP